MDVAVYYFTRSGNTKKLADAVAEALDVTAHEVSEPLPEWAEVVFLGSSPYAFDVDPAVAAFLEKNADKIGKLVCFGSSASGKSTYQKVRELADKSFIPIHGEFFNCPGHFMFIHKNRPNEADLKAAANFAKTALEKLS